MDLLSSPSGTILIVDDDPYFIKAMKRELFDDGFELITAASGSDALTMLVEHAVDVVISDLKMIGMGGLEFIAAAQKILGHETQYIVMTGWGSLETAVAAMQLGVINYLTKPINSGVLRNSIYAALEVVKAIRTSQQLRNEECQKNALIFATVQAGVLLIDRDSFSIADANNAAAAMLETQAPLLIGKSIQQLFYQPESDAYALPIHPLSRMSELNLNTGSGQLLPVQMTSAEISLNDRSYLLISFMDISAQKKVEADLKASQETFSAIVERSLDGIVILSRSGQIQFINPAAAVFFERSKDELLGQPFGFAATLGKPTELHFPRDSRSALVAEMRVAATRWQGEAAFVATLRDITHRKELEESIQHMATHDPLTGLPNRNLLPDQLEHAIALARRNKRRMALLFVDLDNFKPINDTFGHSIGDAVLKNTAQRLIEGIRASDFIARVGGDEFIVVLQEVGDIEAVEVTARRIIDLVSAPAEIDGCQCQLGASVGISLFPDHAETTEGLIQTADAAMYQVKKQTKNNYCFYSAEMSLDSGSNDR